MNTSSTSKRELILLTGHDLFWKYGIRRVSVEEICKKSGVSKMTFYKYFSNKSDLVKTLMDGIIQDALGKYRRIIDSNQPYPEKVEEMIKLKREQVRTMSNEFFSEFALSTDPEMIRYLNQLSHESIAMITGDFRKAQQQGDIRKDVKVEFIMYMMNRLIEMTHDDRLQEMYKSPEDLVMEITQFMFYGIMDRKEVK